MSEAGDVTGALTETEFVDAIEKTILASDKDLASSRDLAYRIIHDFQDDNKIWFGDPRYEWSAQSAKEIAAEYEVQFWDTGER